VTAPAEDAVLVTTSGVSAFTGQGYVHVRWGRLVGHLTPDEARALGLHIIECADAAVTDALVVKNLRAYGFTEERAAEFLLRIRALRGQS
jgi:hypothetical protein